MTPLKAGVGGNGGGAAPTLRQPLFTISTPSRAERFLKAMIYGDYGTGKTTLAASAVDVPTMGDVLLIDAENGDLSVRDKVNLARVGINDFRTMGHIFAYLSAHCTMRDRNDQAQLDAVDEKFLGAAQGRRFRTVIIDSLTEVQRYAMMQIMGVQVGRERLDAEPEQAQFQQWGANAQMVEKLVRYFRDLPMHVIFICSEKRTENDRKQIIREPNLPGKLSTNVQGFLDVVGYLARADTPDGTIRRLYLQPTPTVQAKNRFASDSVPFLDQPTMTDLAKIVLPQAAAAVKKVS